MPELQNNFQRQIAYKLRISDILNGAFIKDGSSAGYILLNDAKASRANIIATVVYKSESPNFANAVIDDGTGKISLRAFERLDFFSKVDVGDAVMVVGRIREFNNEKHIVPEILKKIDSFEWVGVRRAELKGNVVFENKVPENSNPVEAPADNVNSNIYSLIKSLDKGEGVPVEDVIKNSSDSKAEDAIQRLLENGDVFEIKPGRLKVLE